MSPRPILTPLLVLLLLGSAAPLSGAIAGERKRPRVTRAPLHLVASKRGAIVRAQNLAPGDRVTGAVTIANRGTRAGTFTLRGKVRGSRPMAEHLVLTVRERRNRALRVVYSGRLARFRRVKLGVIRSGQARRFRFTVSLRASAPNALQGQRASVSFTWRAVQAS